MTVWGSIEFGAARSFHQECVIRPMNGDVHWNVFSTAACHTIECHSHTTWILNRTHRFFIFCTPQIYSLIKSHYCRGKKWMGTKFKGNINAQANEGMTNMQ